MNMCFRFGLMIIIFELDVIIIFLRLLIDVLVEYVFFNCILLMGWDEILLLCIGSIVNLVVYMVMICF